MKDEDLKIIFFVIALTTYSFIKIGENIDCGEKNGIGEERTAKEMRNSICRKWQCKRC